MAYQLKTGKTYSFGPLETTNPKRRICSMDQNIQFDESGNKIFVLQVMLGTYDEGDWTQKLEEFAIAVILPYSNGTIDLADVYKAIGELNLNALADWESDI